MKILIITLSNLGDVVLTLPVFQAVSEAYPGLELHCLVGPAARAVFEGDSRLAKVIPLDKKISWSKKIDLLWAVRRERYDIIIDLRYSLFGLLGGAKRRNRYRVFGRGRHRAERHLAALRGLIDERSPSLSFLKKNPARDSARVVVAAVGSKSDTKKWPAEYYARVLDRLILEEGCEVTLVGDIQDKAACAEVLGFMSQKAEDLSGNTDFKALCTLISEAALVITNDSAPLHIADALKIPVAAVFGPTDPAKYGPRSDRSAAFQSPLFCVPCQKAQCRYHHECMTELRPDEVYEKVRRLLNGNPHPHGLKILLVRLDRIGDVALSLPAIQAVREHFPDARISVMVRPYTQLLLEGHPSVDEVIPYFYENGGRHGSLLGNLRFIGEIRRRRFDAALVFHPGFRPHAVPFLAGIPRRVGFKSRAPFFLTNAVEDRRHEGDRHESDYALDIVRAFGVSASRKKNFELTVSPLDTETVERTLAREGVTPGERLVALHAGASCPSKRWPKECFAELGRKIARQMRLKVVLVGGTGEVCTASFLESRIGDGVLNFTGRLNLRELNAFLKRCAVLVSNDSGPVHLAAGVGTKTLCIFGRNRKGLNAERWKALGEGHRVIQKEVGCVVCLAHRCTIDFECLKAVSVEEIFENLREMLS
jgi:lipopolysaccharide heptosyltransferase II